ncbi:MULTISPECIES: F0F1 ATP synthase subunit epsilon [Kocuria]|uniref:ATP synthase F0F1 subunit epsilon n=1 Tax=Kocuria rosea subsp. polaris TaxID=136273 RepID=A0A0W8I7V3_KOCRO|nr:F0F1 ATP synthase subunit epsilon [Kocuria polaris]KUG55440.1 ATP synthase F0F1 subunit epsilon [Kocuria polaris]
MAEMIVEIVSLEESVWTGTARMVRVRTSEGDIGILPGHEAVAGILKPGDFAVDPADGARVEGTIDAGFVFVDHDRVTIVADNVELSGAAAA